jgi:hypothetical protein
MKFLLNRGVLFVFLFALLATSAFAHRNHAWGNYHWARTANPFTVRIGDNVDNTWQGYYNEAMADWNTSSVINTLGYAGSVSTRRCPVTTGRVEVCNNRYGQTGWLGIAGITIGTGSHITGSYVKLNDSYTMNDATKDLVTCQEIGHAFGLGHQDENFNNAPLGTCMDYTTQATAEANRQPNAHDFQMLEQIYNHLDSFTTIGMTVSPDVTNTDFGNPREWGRPVKFDAHGNAVLFVREYPRTGELHFTHIFPAPGRKGGQFYNAEEGH